jgi:uncharacterized protein
MLLSGHGGATPALPATAQWRGSSAVRDADTTGSAMIDPAGPLLSVRADARRLVAPDYVTLAGLISVSRETKADAVRAAAGNLDQLTASLAGLGGAALDSGTARQPLTWSARSATTHAERDHDEETGRYALTGQVTATVAVVITVRRFELLDSLSAMLAAHEALSVHDVTWDVDWDNPAWPAVRAAAIQAAIRKGRDYATALGGSLDRVEHIADAGLLGGSDTGSFRFTGAARASQRASAAGGEGEAPELDPVPQELIAVIEARFIAAGVTLTGL